MHVTYTPADGDAQTWEYDHGRVRVSEAQVCLKRLPGVKWDAFQGELLLGDPLARKVLLWHLLRREHTAMRWEDVPDFCMGELLVELSLADMRVIRDKMAAGRRNEQVDSMIADLDAEIASGEAAGGEGPKAS